MMQTELDAVGLPVSATSPAAAIRYHELSYVALNVSDLERSRAFYETILGLQYSGTGTDGGVFFRCSRNHHSIALYRSPHPGLRQIGWELENEDTLAAAFAALQSRNVPVRWLGAAESDALHLDRAFCMLDPTTGVRHDYFSAIGKFAIEPFRPTVANILRIGHVVLKTDRYDEAVKFATETMNFRVSDLVRGKVTFMRGFPLPYHHGIGIINGTKPMLHHVNFMVDTIDDVGRAIARMKANDIPVVYGPGRHPPSDSIFLYFLDPDGLTVEYSFGMEMFPEHDARKPRMFEPVAALDYWASQQDPRFGAVGAIDPAGMAPR
jgi:2,3-dihydroxy-p-cumate/2,3-dihydroxybenzoate 3,4-dioxygenase